MIQIIDIENEKAVLWSRVYADMRELLHKTEPHFVLYANNPSHHNISSISVDEDGVVIALTNDGETKLIEEFPDETMYSIYQDLIFHLFSENYSKT